MTLLLSAMAGANIIYGLGMLEAGVTFDIPTLLMDDEIARMVQWLLGGIEVNDETLNLEAIKEVAPFDTYLTHQSTMAGLYGLSQPKLIDRFDYDRWLANGSKTMYERCQEEAQNILKNYQQPRPLSEDQKSQLRSIVEEAENEIGVSDFWKGNEDKKLMGLES
jgi:trimethylamine--corrinoid protein Co-methyltransferase